MSAGPRACRSRHPARARPPPPGHVAARDAAPRAGYRGDPLRRVRGTHHRRADRAPDPQPGPAQQGLREHRRDVPARPRRLHLLAEVRHPRPPRRRPAVGARDRGACRGRGGRAQVARGAPRRLDPRAPRAARGDRHPLRELRARRREPVLRRQRHHRAGARGVHGRAAQVRRFLWRADHGGRPGRPGRLGRARPRQARRRPRAGDDGHQRGQGRRDRRRLRRASRRRAPSTPTK